MKLSPTTDIFSYAHHGFLATRENFAQNRILRAEPADLHRVTQLRDSNNMSPGLIAVVIVHYLLLDPSINGKTKMINRVRLNLHMPAGSGSLQPWPIKNPLSK
jgi:hypothetical protein